MDITEIFRAFHKVTAGKCTYHDPVTNIEDTIPGKRDGDPDLDTMAILAWRLRQIKHYFDIQEEKIRKQQDREQEQAASMMTMTMTITTTANTWKKSDTDITTTSTTTSTTMIFLPIWFAVSLIITITVMEVFGPADGKDSEGRRYMLGAGNYDSSDKGPFVKAMEGRAARTTLIIQTTKGNFSSV